MAASAQASIFTLDPYDYGEARAISIELGLAEPVAVTLVRRGVRTVEAAREFLEGREEHDPLLFRGMAEARRRCCWAPPSPGAGSPSTATTTWTASARPRSWSARCASSGRAATG